ncbi:MAG: hypothetical protein JST04_07840 [Bdellovibrionales bacterium]|nr:hypothetical protein [Bdellovibrionales bacterium]
MGTLRGFLRVFGVPLALASGLGASGCLSTGEIQAIGACVDSGTDCEMAQSNPDLTSTTSLAGTTSYRLRGVTTAPYPFIEYLPGGYSPTGGKRWPLIVMLHGIGEEGQGATEADLDRAGVHGPNRRIREGREFPAVILTPMAPAWWDDNLTCAFVDFALANYRIDSTRVYVTGLSMGGGGAWGLAGKCANKVAALVPIAGAAGANGTYAANIFNNKVSVWAFHNQDDGTVAIGNSDGWMDAFGGLMGSTNSVRSGNPTGNPTKTAHQRSDHVWEWLDPIASTNLAGYNYPREIHYTVYPSGGHDAWTKTYANEALWNWMFQQVKR